MRRWTILFFAALGACYTGPDPASSSTSTSTRPTETSAEAVSADLPCDVSQLLTDRCTSCHGNPPSGGAVNRLMSSADLKAASASDPSVSAAELSLRRMRDPAKPMPPDGALSAAEIAVFEAWVKGGMPSGTCTPGGDTNTPSVCTSNKKWTRGDRGSSEMHPGVACIDCHTRGDGPLYAFAGTVYPTAHEPDDCDGVGGVSVVITDANGKTFTMNASSTSGNFAGRTSFASPYRAKVVAGSKVREMKTAQTNGDCNACHTERGTKGAPGRIMAP